MIPDMGAIIGASIVVSIFAFFTLLIIVLTCIVLSKYIYIKYLAKKNNVPFKVLLGKRLRANFIVLGFSYVLLILAVLMVFFDENSKPSISGFSLFYARQDYQYGSVTFPKGTLVYRDAYAARDSDKIGLSGLKSARFAEPIMMRNIPVYAIEIYPLRVELAEDTAIGPVYQLQYEAESNKMIWVENAVVPNMTCQKGDVALFIDVSEETNDTQWNKKDGVDAHFVPEEWQFVKCETNYQIKVPDPVNLQIAWNEYPFKSVEPLSDGAISALTDYYSALASKDDEALSKAMIHLQALADEGQEDVQYIVEQIKRNE